MGHVGNGLIFKHYRQVVRESAAIEYWNIFPEQPENVLRFSEQNVPRSRPLATRARSAETGRMVPMFQRPLAYKKTGRQYAGEMGVSIKTAEKWMRIGKPLDDPEALKRLDAGKYEMSVAQHAEAYSTTQFQIKIWRRAGWPLDNVEGVKIFLASRKQTALRSFNGPSNRAVRVIGLSPKDARIRPATPVAACRA